MATIETKVVRIDIDDCSHTALHFEDYASENNLISIDVCDNWHYIVCTYNESSKISKFYYTTVDLIFFQTNSQPYLIKALKGPMETGLNREKFLKISAI